MARLARCFVLFITGFPQESRAKNTKIEKNEKHAGKKNKMKPTNPNADTYVEINTCLSQFPANPLVEHPHLTH